MIIIIITGLIIVSSKHVFPSTTQAISSETITVVVTSGSLEHGSTNNFTEKTIPGWERYPFLYMKLWMILFVANVSCFNTGVVNEVGQKWKHSYTKLAAKMLKDCCYNLSLILIISHDVARNTGNKKTSCCCRHHALDLFWVFLAAAFFHFEALVPVAH